jgi:hypothetical protein
LKANGFSTVGAPRRRLLSTTYALHCAAEKGDEEICRMLLQEGADPAPSDEQAHEDELKYSTVTGPASGDPKIMGLYGKRFQIHRPGDHALLIVPNAKKRHGSLLEVSAQVKELEIGDPCLLFIKKVTLTGSWLGGTTVQVPRRAPPAPTSR